MRTLSFCFSLKMAALRRLEVGREIWYSDYVRGEGGREGGIARRKVGYSCMQGVGDGLEDKKLPSVYDSIDELSIYRQTDRIFVDRAAETVPIRRRLPTLQRHARNAAAHTPPSDAANSVIDPIPTPTPSPSPSTLAHEPNPTSPLPPPKRRHRLHCPLHHRPHPIPQDPVLALHLQRLQPHLRYMLVDPYLHPWHWDADRVQALQLLGFQVCEVACFLFVVDVGGRGGFGLDVVVVLGCGGGGGRGEFE